MAARGHNECGKKAEDIVRRFQELIHLLEDNLLSEVRNQLALTGPESEKPMKVTDQAEDILKRVEEIILLFKDRLLSEVRSQFTLAGPASEESIEVTDPGEVMHLAEDIRQVFKDDLLTDFMNMHSLDKETERRWT